MCSELPTLLWRRIPGLHPNDDTKPDQYGSLQPSMAVAVAVGVILPVFRSRRRGRGRTSRRRRLSLSSIRWLCLRWFLKLPRYSPTDQLPELPKKQSPRHWTVLNFFCRLMDSELDKKALTLIGKEEGIKGYWKGNLPQKLFQGKDGELSVLGRLAAGASAGMTSTFGDKRLSPKKIQKRTEASLVTALVLATVATTLCYPLETIRRQMQMKVTPYVTVLDAFPGIVGL